MADQSAYQRLEHSERHPSPDSRLLGAADEGETFQVTIVLRRRTDGEKVPDYSEIAARSSAQRPASQEEFARKYGAAPEEIKQVEDFARSSGLKVDESHADRRTVRLSGTVAQMSKAFDVKLGRYERQSLRRGRLAPQSMETYRGRDGFISVPEAIAPFVVGVFGLDNRNITHRSMATGDPTGTHTITVPQVRGFYDFPTNSAAGQTIAIFSESGYALSDIQKYFTNLGLATPTITNISVDASNGASEVETTQDICIAGSAAPGAAIAVYFTTYDQKGWVDLINRVNHPSAGDPHCSVMSNSFYVMNGDDEAIAAGVSHSWLTAVSAAFQDSALNGVTQCIASGDTGAQSKVGDGKAHVQYPVSDPGVLGCGGTTIGAISGSTFTEWVWNDTFTIGTFTAVGATGGGISAYFPLPAYQASAGVPVSLFNGKAGRGVPDVAANASPNSGYYPIWCAGAPSEGYPNPFAGNGTSASAPLIAGLIAVLNAALGDRIGFLNTTLYGLGTSVTRDIFGPPGPANNSLNGTTGYSAKTGWNACTGWGVLDGKKLLTALKSSLGAPAAGVLGAPVVGKNKDSRLEIFVVSKDGGLWHNWETTPSGSWSGWNTVLPTKPLSSGPPRVISNADGRLEVFGTASGGALWHIWQATPNGGWTSGASLGTPGKPIIGGVSVGINKSGALEVFGVAQDDQLHHIWQTSAGGGWSAWASLGAPAPGLSIGDPRVISNLDGRLEVFLQAKDGAIWHVWQTAPSGAWSAWSSLGKPAVAISNGAPFPGRNADGRLETFATGADGNLYHIWQGSPGGGWSAWAQQTHPAGIQVWGLGSIFNNQNGAFQVSAIGSDGALWTIGQTAPSNGWGSWRSLGGAPPSKALNGDQIPAVGLNSNGLLEMFVLGADGAVWEMSQ